MLTLNDFAEVTGHEVHGKRVRILHIPVPIGLLLARAMSKILPNPPLTVSNVVGMNEFASVNSEPFLAKYGIRPRSFISGLTYIKELECARAKESVAILEYVFSGRRVHDYYVQLYEKALVQYGLQAHAEDAWLFRSQLLLGAFDALTKFVRPRGVFQRKLLVAAAIIECMPASSDMFLPKPRSRLSMLLAVVGAGFSSVLKWAVGIVLFCIQNAHSKNA